MFHTILLDIALHFAPNALYYSYVLYHILKQPDFLPLSLVLPLPDGGLQPTELCVYAQLALAYMHNATTHTRRNKRAHHRQRHLFVKCTADVKLG